MSIEPFPAPTLELDEIVKEHLLPLRAFLASMSVHPDLIDDVAQNVFLEVLRNQDKFDGRRPFRAWLFGIAKNVVYQEFRKHSRDRRLREGYAAETLARAEFCEPKQEDFWSDKRRLKALKDCINSLPDKTRNLVNLRFEGGYKGEELSEMLGMTHAAVRMSLSRIRKSLRGCVEQKTQGEWV
ncbi:MAG: sigma-70 family RNA polymerase sigma factor [Opitutales bacterium]